MLSALILLAATPATPHAELWIPECRPALSASGPAGYRECALDANRTREEQLAAREGEYRALIEGAARVTGTEGFDEDAARFRTWRDEHCDYMARAMEPIARLAETRRLSCRYFLTDRRVAELDAMILLLQPTFDLD